MPTLVLIGFAVLAGFTFMMALRGRSHDATVVVTLYALLFLGLIALAYVR
jgi:hypothetical protein